MREGRYSHQLILTTRHRRPYGFTGSSIADDQAAADANRERWGKVKVDTGGLFNTLDLSKFGAEPPDETGQMKQFRPYSPYTSTDIMSAAEERQRQKQPAPSWLGAMDLNGQVINKPVESHVDQSMHTDIKIDVVVNAIDPNGKALGDAIGDAVTEKVDAKVSQLLQTTRAGQKEVE